MKILSQEILDCFSCGSEINKKATLSKTWHYPKKCDRENYSIRLLVFALDSYYNATSECTSIFMHHVWGFLSINHVSSLRSFGFGLCSKVRNLQLFLRPITRCSDETCSNWLRIERRPVWLALGSCLSEALLVQSPCANKKKKLQGDNQDC